LSFINLVWLTIPAYVILQVVALLRSSGWMRIAAALPLVVMVPVFALTIHAYVLDSNLWPLLLLMASPAAMLYVAVVAFVARRPGAPAAR
jgi:hypothetical protein